MLRIRCALFALVVACSLPARAAKDSPALESLPVARSERQKEALRRVEQLLRGRTSLAEVQTAVIAAKDAYIELPKTELGKATWGRYKLNTLGISFDAVRFRTPKAKGKLDLFWGHSMPPIVMEWWVLPVPQLPNGQFLEFKDTRSIARFQPKHPSLGGNNLTLLQSMTEGQIKPDTEYIVWMTFHDNKPVEMDLGLAVAKAGAFGGADNPAKVRVGEALGIDPGNLVEALRSGMTAWAREELTKNPARHAERIDDHLPIHEAAHHGEVEIVEQLLKAGADIEGSCFLKWSPLMFAVNKGHNDVIRCLLRHKARLDVEDYYGKTPLMVAAESMHVETVKLLLQQKVDIEKRDKKGWRAVHYAARCDDPELAPLLNDVLARAGADMKAKTNKGETPADLAAQGPDSFQQFLRAGKKGR